jgi:hypothetical protein
MHDRNGTPLKVGDKVMLPGTITDLQAYTDYCNATVTLLPMRGSTSGQSWCGNTGQTVLVERHDA